MADDRLSKRAAELREQGRRRWGRPRLRWEDRFMRDVRKTGEEGDWKMKTWDRGGWRRIADASSFRQIMCDPRPTSLYWRVVSIGCDLLQPVRTVMSLIVSTIWCCQCIVFVASRVFVFLPHTLLLPFSLYIYSRWDGEKDAGSTPPLINGKRNREKLHDNTSYVEKWT